MAKRSVAELDFDFGDDGELELTGFSEDDVFEEDEIEEEEGVEEEEEVEVEEEEEVGSSDFETRLTNMERSIQNIPQMVTNAIVQAMGKGGQKQEEEEEEEIPEELDNKQMVNILAKRMEKSVNKRISAIMEQNEPALKQARVTAEFQGCAIKYGENFKNNMIPVAKMISRVEKAGGKITAEDAYLSLVDAGAISGTKTGKTKTQATTKKTLKSVQVDADSEDSVGTPPPRPKFNSKKMKEMSDTDVFQHAWNTSLLSTVKRKKSA